MPVPFNSSLNNQPLKLLTPTRSNYKLDQLFSPRNQTLRIQTPTSHLPRATLPNDMTYQIDLTQVKTVPSLNHYLVDDEIDLTNMSQSNYFPRSSTGIKGPRPRVPLDIDDEVVSPPTSFHDTVRGVAPQLEDEIDDHDDFIPEYKPIHQIIDPQPIRATCFHPSGDVYVVGSNSHKLNIYNYPNEQDFKLFNETAHDEELQDYYPIEPEIAFQFFQLHCGSIYCATFNDSGDLLATGSNDRTIHIIRYDSQKHQPKDHEYKLTTLHNGTVRDVMFMPNEENEGSCFLVSAGAGDNHVCVTDCGNGMKTLRVLDGHEEPVMSLHRWEDKNVFVSGSLDGTIRMWDVRSKLCCKTIDTNKLLGPLTSSKETETTTGDFTTATKLSAVNVVRVEQTGKLLVSGHKDGRCMLYDIKAGRVIQSFKQHDDEIRTLNFSPKSYYLLTAGYDNKIKLMDLQGELGSKLPYVEIGTLKDKIVQTAWHPREYNFVTTCANGSANLWAIPERQTRTTSPETTS